jgi:hypothetical protein
VPDHFAVVQTATMQSGPANVVRDANQHITAYDLRFGVAGVRTVCSGGGTVLPFRNVVGWTREPNIAPLPPDEILYQVVGVNNTVFDMTKTRARAVLDVRQDVHWFGPIADVIGRCQFGRDLVRSDVFWAGVPANGTAAPIIVDGNVVDLDVTMVLPGGNRIR